ncbi:unnamed protein product [Rotaria sordida]|uniref:Integrase catalytic domain-containing protein n=1 Tax=Rotaria sordida TaxID=392033 RepID=A0A815FI02_9BILA|nr:unnamed protein product [Rotaria sordida]CAF1590825.1 unnamed protein product [Rotaria sordida]
MIQELLHFGLIRPSDSPCAAPAMLVAKHDGTWRMVVDYKKLNNITIKDNHPLPNMEQAIQLLGGGYKFFSKLDMKSGFCQILIKEEDKFKTAFITPYGLFEWNVLAQGLKNSPPSFQRHNFQLNLVKYSIFHQQVDYLSHAISEHGVKPTNEKIQAIIKLRQPTKLPEANKFLSALSWYRKFISKFATIATSIHVVKNLTKTNKHKLELGASQFQEFLQLKQLLITSPLFFDFPDDNYLVILTTDASEIGIGDILQQNINGEIKNLYYHSQVTSSTQRRYDPIELEALTIWLCFQRMRSYLPDQHNCLADYLSHHPIQNDEEIFDEDYSISMLLQGEPPETVHAPVNHPPVIGAVVTRSKMKQIQQQQNENDKITPHTVNDISSSSSKDKIEHSNKSPSLLITSNNFDITQIKLEQSKDSNIQKKIKEVMQDPTKHPYVVTNGLLYKLVLMNVASNKKKKWSFWHSTNIFKKLKNKFWWPNMKQSIIQHIQSCLPCQQHNISRTKKPGRLNPIPTPEELFQLIDIDYCGPFQPTPRALSDCSAQTTAQRLFNNYICPYGVPLAILSDQGTHFKNQLMESIAKLIGYNHIFSSVYHPQSNEMIERFNATFVPQIVKLQDLENNNWDEFLSPVVFAYNTSIHATTNYSPFQLQFGRESCLPTDEPSSSFTFNKPNDYYVQLKKNLLIIQQHARDNIIRRQRQYKINYDKQCPDPHYEINGPALIKIHGIKKKLEPKYSITPKIILRKQHPIDWVKDEKTQVESRVHVNDIRSILILKST